MKKILPYVFLVIVLFSCKESNIKYQVANDFITKKVFDDKKMLLEELTLNMDSQLIKGQSYYNEGVLIKWLWYDEPENYPLFGVYFNNSGEFIKTDGIPFVKAHTTSDNYTAIEMVNPPIIKTISGYKDYYNGNLEFKIGYDPGRTDSTQWITLKHYKYDSTHNYYAYFHVLNSNGEILTTDSIELVP